MLSAPPTVVVLHGWGLNNLATRFWCRRLRQAGFAPSPFAYRSLARTLDHNVAALARHIASLPADRPVHLVGHSMGGLMIMQCLAQHRVANLGRVVMVGTPFQGSAPAQKIQAMRFGPWLLGKSIVQWRGVQASDLPAGLELGTIAGTRPVGMGRLWMRLESPHDGTVSLSETHVPFARDRLVLGVTHSEMLLSPLVTAQIAQFLRHGQFTRP